MIATIRDVARAAHRMGLCVLPPREDGTKGPLTKRVTDPSAGEVKDVWATFNVATDRHERPTDEQIERWYGERSGIGIVTGAASGNVEAFEFDDRDTFERFCDTADDAGIGDLVARIRAGYEETTPGGGIHWLIRCAKIEPNTKLARRPKRAEEMKHPTDKTKVLIETRGQVGFIILAPSNGRVHPAGGAYRQVSGGVETIATITLDERDDLWALARAFDQMPREVVPVRSSQVATPAGTRPGDDFNARATWAEVLEPANWRLVNTHNDIGRWRRPGKDWGISATTNWGGHDLFYPFTSSTEFDAERGYSKFSVYAILHHGSDWSAAARELVAKGYGQPGATVLNQSTEPPASVRVGGTKAERPWPEPLDEAAYHGITGEVVRAIEPNTESDPAAVLIQFLIGVGNCIGRGPHAMAEADRHGLNEFAVIVGESSKARKGTSQGHIERLFGLVDQQWASFQQASGLSSGEGLIWAVRDPIEREVSVKDEKGKATGQRVPEVVDTGVSDKRLMVVESEYASVLKVLNREGNTLSPIIRKGWDGKQLASLTKNSPGRATGAHISIVGHVVRDELLRYLADTEQANGFANRYLWPAAKRSKLLPHGGQPIDYEALASKLAPIVTKARQIGLVERDDAAREMWAGVYSALSTPPPGLLGSVTSRAEAHVLRLSTLYAVLDGSALVRTVHLEAALAVWDYCFESAIWLFGDALGDPVADAILAALRQNGELTRSQIRELFSRHQSTDRIAQALQLLLRSGKARVEERPADRDTPGRPVEVWIAIPNRANGANRAPKE